MRRVGVLLLVGLAGLAPAAPAAAGSYAVRSCDAAPGGVNNSWQAVGMPSAHYELAAACPTGGDPAAGLAVRDLIGSPNAPDGSGVEWRFAAPAGTSITRWRYARWLGKDGTNSWEVYARLADGTTLDSCSIPLGHPNCDVGAPAGTNEANANDAFGFAVGSLHFGIRCAAGGLTCATGGLTIHNAWAHLYSSSVTLTESIAPDIGEPSGTLFDGGWRRGAQSVGISASDDLGIRATRVYVDGDLVAETARTCDFTYTLPCVEPPCTPGAGLTCGDSEATATHTIDTAQLPDGERRVEVAAVDAAGNEARAAEAAVRIDNDPPWIAISGPAGETPNADLAVAWSADDGQGSGVTGHDVEVSIDGGPWQPWLDGTSATSGTYAASAGRGYRFRARASDASGLASGWAVSPAVRVVADAPSQTGGGATGSPPPDPAPPDADRPAGTTTASGPDEAPATRRRKSPLRIRVLRWRGTRLLVGGTLAPTATGRVTATYTARPARRLHRVRDAVSVRRGRFAVSLRAPSAGGRTRRGLLTLAYTGDDRHLPRTVRAWVEDR